LKYELKLKNIECRRKSHCTMMPRDYVFSTNCSSFHIWGLYAEG